MSKRAGANAGGRRAGGAGGRPAVFPWMAGLLRVSLLLVLAAVLAGCSEDHSAEAQPLLDRIAHGTEAEVGGTIFGYEQASPAARRVLVGLLGPLRAPSPAAGALTVEASRDEGDFTMLVVRVPWPLPAPATGRQPLILCHRGGQTRVVGYVLPFDDIIGRFSQADLAGMSELAHWWIETYAMKP